jgi:hypothetical protein
VVVLRPEASGEGIGQGVLLDDIGETTRRQRVVHRRAPVLADPDHPHPGTQPLGGERYPGDQAASREWHHQQLDARRLRDDLTPESALPGYHPRVVERVDECGTGLGDETTRRDLGVVLPGTTHHHPGAEAADRLLLGGGDPRRDTHRGRDAQSGRHERYRPTVVARRHRHHSGTALRFVE